MLAIINAGLTQLGLMLKTGTVVDASIIAAPSSTKNKDGQRDPEMHQTKKGRYCMDTKKWCLLTRSTKARTRGLRPSAA